MHAARIGRRGFTLVELLVVISIIAVLAALVTSGVVKYLEVIPKTTTVSEISQLKVALETFKLKYHRYPPSRLVLPPESDAESKQIVAALWPRINFAACSWGNSGNVTLEGDQCLVYFLRGPTGNGWSTDPSNPTKSGGTRVQPFFEFKPERLFDRTQNLNIPEAGYFYPQGGPFYSYLDPYMNIRAHFKPYAYFCTGLAPNSYGNHCPTIHLPLSAMPAMKNPQPQPLVPYFRVVGGVNQFYNPNSFQIISAGKDQKFGPGGNYVGGSNNSLENVYDDLANFYDGFLGVAP